MSTATMDTRIDNHHDFGLYNDTVAVLKTANGQCRYR